jgi:uncharacterized coiled-coil DUF342 family protein
VLKDTYDAMMDWLQWGKVFDERMAKLTLEALASLRAELQATRRERDSWKAEAQGRFKHYVGKTYELTQANMQKLIDELDTTRAELAEVRMSLDTLRHTHRAALENNHALRAELDALRAERDELNKRVDEESGNYVAMMELRDAEIRKVAKIEADRDRYLAALEEIAKPDSFVSVVEYNGERMWNLQRIARAALAGGKETG